MHKGSKHKITTALLLTILPTLAFAQGKSGDQFMKVNAMVIGLVSMIFVLLFAILLLGNTLRQLSFVYREKMRKERSEKRAAAGGVVKALLVLVASGLSLSAFAQDAVDGAAKVQKSPYIQGMLRDEFYALMSIITLEIVVIIALLFMIRTMVKVISARPELAGVAKKIVKRVPFWDKFNKSVAIEKEEDILLDHNYDGIQELDNSLPPWWKYGFYLSIVVGVIYFWYYHGGGGGLTSHEEYVESVEKAQKEIAEYLATAADNVDENTVVMLDGSDIAAGKNLFIERCAACHVADGGGNIGPNLTDDYWIYGGSIKDVFMSIKYGRPNGMQPWEKEYSPKQIAQLASFVKSLRGTTPANPKDKQGTLYIEAETTATDSTATVQEQ